MKRLILVCAICLVGFVNNAIAGRSVIPAVFAYLCDDNASTAIGQCGPPPHPVYGTSYQLHYVNVSRRVNLEYLIRNVNVFTNCRQ